MEQINFHKLVMMRYTHSGNSNFIPPQNSDEKNLQYNFIQQLSRVYENEFEFCPSQFDDFPLEVIIDYIKRTHTYYLTKKLPEIEQSIHLLLKDYSHAHPLLAILNDFYFRYSSDLSEHIKEEENTLLPYVDYLLQCEKKAIDATDFFYKTCNYAISSFTEEHHDTEEELETVNNTISLYNPPPTNVSPYRILRSQLKTFEKDLSVHALIEDKVLIPRALILEKKLTDNYIDFVKLN